MARANPGRYADVDLAGLRRSAGLTQGRLAEVLGVKQPAVSKWELGERDLGSEWWAAYADACSVESSDVALAVNNTKLKRSLQIQGSGGVGSEMVEVLKLLGQLQQLTEGDRELQSGIEDLRRQVEGRARDEAAGGQGR